MCGRYQALMPEEMMDRLGIPAAMRDAMPTGEVRPTDQAVVITRNGAAMMRWGFSEDFLSGPLINAKAEKAWGNYYADSTENRRVAVPTTGFFEWKAESQLDLLGEPMDPVKVKYLFQQPGMHALYLAGIHKKCVVQGEVVDCFSIFTTEPNDSMRDVHDRMPVLLCESELVAWLNDAGAAREILARVPPALVRREG